MSTAGTLRPLSSSELSAELRSMGGVYKVSTDHSKLTPEFVIDAVLAFRRTGEINDAFDEEGIEAFAEIAEIRTEVERVLSQPAPRPERSRPTRSPGPERASVPSEMQRILSERVAASSVLNVPHFEGRRNVRGFLDNRILPRKVKQEIVRIYEDLAGIDGAQEAFRTTYRFTQSELLYWAQPKADPVPAPIDLPTEVERAVSARVASSSVLDVPHFERRRSVPFLRNDRLPYHIKREVAAMYADLAAVENGQQAFCAMYKFEADEIAAWAEEAPARSPVTAPVESSPVPRPEPPVSHDRSSAEGERTVVVPIANGNGHVPGNGKLVLAPPVAEKPARRKPKDDPEPVRSRTPSMIGNPEILQHVRMVVEGDDAMEKAWQLSQLYAKGRMIMLYRGERGTGKELFPRAVHQMNKKGGKFVAQNCAAVSAGIIESELFGHEKGAFTDARTEREGIFGQVKDGGTILLDEIGDMPWEQQAKLLRVLENRTYTRVGGNKEFTISENTKIVAATNRNLEQLVAEGKFRSDLYDRLRGCQIFIPPLRERHPEHKSLLINHMLGKYGHLDCPLQLSDAARAYMMGLEYPGNVRELRDHIERAALIAQSTAPANAESIEISLDTVRLAEDTPLSAIMSTVAAAKKPAETHVKGALAVALPENVKATNATVDFSLNLDLIDENIHEIEDAVVNIVAGLLMKRNRHNQSQVAKILGITRGSLRMKLRQLESLDTEAKPKID